MTSHALRGTAGHDDALERVRRALETEEPAPPLATLAAAVGLSRAHLARAFRQRYGLPPAAYARAHRFRRLRAGLAQADSVSDAVAAAGFGSDSRVYERSDALLGMSPAHWRRGGAGIAIRYTTLGSPFGRVLVAATARGLCAVDIGDDDDALSAALRAAFPQAMLSREDDGRDTWLAPALARIAGELAGSEAPAPPIDVAGTAFQWRVWQALTHIPRGTTVSYAELAATIGAPKAARAVGSACGSNRLALVVPCHRVIREDGSLGGWRWGLERKRVVLEAERAIAGSLPSAHPPRARTDR
jgi:AraC family transcriptional regulator of adaptative response/methylated-DNA-[protein]-cysteine methyltransferase